MHCQNYVSAEAVFAGVHNRNHCPYCLWSKHLDLYQSGDRMAICKSRMRPVALTLKQTHKRYVHPYQGELMIVHQCDGCGKISINRIAADDDPDRILAVLDASAHLEAYLVHQLEAQGILMLCEAQRWVVMARLFGGAEPACPGEVSSSVCG